MLIKFLIFFGVYIFLILSIGVAVALGVEVGIEHFLEDKDIKIEGKNG